LNAGVQLTAVRKQNHLTIRDDEVA